MARTKHRYDSPPSFFFSTYSRCICVLLAPCQENASRRRLCLTRFLFVCFSPMHRAARHGIGRDPGRGYHGKLHVRHGKRWPPPGTVSEPFFHLDGRPFVIHIYPVTFVVVASTYPSNCDRPPRGNDTLTCVCVCVCVCTVQLLRVQSFLALNFLPSNQFKIPEWNSFDSRNFEILIGLSRRG